MPLPGQGGAPEGPGLSVCGGAAPATSSYVTQGKSHHLSELQFPENAESKMNSPWSKGEG